MDVSLQRKMENTIGSKDVYSSENVIAKFLNQFQEAIKFTMNEIVWE
jgi:hypothetical protein